MKNLSTSLLLAAAGLFAACGGDDHDHGHPHPHPHPGDTGTAGASDDGAGHEHTDSVDLGTVTIGGIQVQATRRSALAADGEIEIDLTFDGALPEAVRGWIGAESNVGARIARFMKEDERTMHGHPTAPAALQPEHRLWLEITGAGTGSFALK